MSDAAAAAALAVAVAEAGVVVVVSLAGWPRSEVAALMLGGVPFTGAGEVVEADCVFEAGDPHTFLWLRGSYSACKEGERALSSIMDDFRAVYRRFVGGK